jgi:hypothetical protein
MTKAIIIPKKNDVMLPKMNALVRHFHILCQCSSFFSNCLKYSKYLSLENTALYIGIENIVIGIINNMNNTPRLISLKILSISPKRENEIKHGKDEYREPKL